MSELVGDFLLKRLSEWNVKRIYGYPGDGSNGIMGALNRAGEQFEFIQTRHEEMAAFMACAHAKFTGQVGVCTATSGPGAIHLLNGLYDAKKDHQPVVAIVGQQARAAMGANTSKRLILFRCSRTSLMNTCIWRPVQDRFATWSIGPYVLPCPSVP
ncbi:thiamine pyrophosphate-binding protein [Modicisalibacter luteus]|uniref:thiamine pyrophosphate-binding protein n=1 Tax=Modicisalibacter luteus TaxID=453962 RepID=UPI003624BB49